MESKDYNRAMEVISDCLYKYENEKKGKSKKEDSASKCCDCTEGMANQLEDFVDYFAIVYEGLNNQTVLIGTIYDVIDGEVLHMVNTLKIVNSTGGSSTALFHFDLYINVCDISEFAPQFEVTSATETQENALQNQVMQNANATRLL